MRRTIVVSMILFLLVLGCGEKKSGKSNEMANKLGDSNNADSTESKTADKSNSNPLLSMRFNQRMEGVEFQSIRVGESTTTNVGESTSLQGVVSSPGYLGSNAGRLHRKSLWL